MNGTIHHKKIIEKKLLTIVLDVLYAEKEKKYLLIFENITQIVKNSLFIECF